MYTTEILDTTYTKKRLSDAIIQKGHLSCHKFLAYTGYMTNKINLGGIKKDYIILLNGRWEFFSNPITYIKRFKNATEEHFNYLIRTMRPVTLEIL